jgi:hypothetical protein
MFLISAFLLLFWACNAGAAISPESPEANTGMSAADEKIIRKLSDAETACRLIAVFEIQEEGAQDYVIGEIIRDIIKQKRWIIIYKILSNHYYFPQSSSWILMELEKNPHLEPLIGDRHEYLKKADELTARILKEIRNREEKR